MRTAHTLRVTFLTLLCSACGDVSKPATPRLIPGGGVGDGKITGTLNVYVTDEDTRAPMLGATVRVGASADPAACVALTNSTGLAIFDPKSCPTLTAPVTLTASATAHAPSTWIGFDGVNATVPLRAMPRPDVDQATVSGTIAGWATIPPPATGHQTLAFIGASQAPDLGDRANDLPQGMRTINLLGGIGTTDIPANVCVRNVLADDCSWKLVTRTGSQAHFAILFDQDTKGTPNDDSDDVRTLIGWAIKTNLTFSKGDAASGETLEMIADADMQTFTAAFPTTPSGMNYVAAYPMINLGAAGRIPAILPVLDLTHTSTRVPKAIGPLAGASYDLLAQAQDAKGQAAPATLAWLRKVNPAGTVALSAWLPPPASLSTAGGTFSFTPVAGASLHSAELKDANGQRAWSVTIFDGSSSFTLPGVSPDPVPAGMITYSASALLIPGINLGNVQFDDAKDLVTAISSDEITYTH